MQGNTEEACIFQLTDQYTGKFVPAVFVRRDQEIINYYPDATAQGR
ncbi:hypothetical protein RintRC_4712 [Richelia intracellularis]|nr:hypothetical protein RintRC_4712 [Richelia intracellularis]